MTKAPSPAPIAIYEKPDASVDIVLLTYVDGSLKVLLAKREAAPFKGRLALPGGYIHVTPSVDGAPPDENAEATARRVLLEKLKLRVPYLEQLYSFTGRKRDARGWSISVAYVALVFISDLEGRDQKATSLVDVGDLPALPFDHNEQIAMAVARLRGKAYYSSMPLFLLGPEFTMGDAEKVYRRILGDERSRKMDSASFRRFINEQDVMEPVPGEFRRNIGEAGRPSQVYRMKGPALDEFDRPVLSARSR